MPMNADLPDYEKAPNVWGSAKVAAWFPGFKLTMAGPPV